MLLILYLIICFAVFVNIASATYSQNTENEILPLTSSPECQPIILRKRLIRMIELDESFGFQLIIRSECKHWIDPDNPQFLAIFEYLMNISQTHSMSQTFIGIMLRGNSYSSYMWTLWHRNRTLLPIKILKLFKKYLKDPASAIIYSKSLNYPKGSEERSFLDVWLVEIQGRTLHWPFSSRSHSNSDFDISFSPYGRIKSPNSKSSNPAIPGSVLNLSPFEDIPEIGMEQEISKDSGPPVKIDEDIFDKDGKSVTEEPEQLVPLGPMKFAHICGFVTGKKRLIIKNNREIVSHFGTNGLLSDDFLGFASSSFSIGNYAKSARNPKRSFLIRSQSALTQKVRQSTGKIFAACHIVDDTLVAMIKGPVSLIVLDRQPDDNYNIKYPEHAYQSLRQVVQDLTSVKIPIKRGDIVLMMPSFLFIGPNHFLAPHDLYGVFSDVKLESFAANFVGFANFVQLKADRVGGILAVGGMIF